MTTIAYRLDDHHHHHRVGVGVGLLLFIVAVLLAGCGSSKTEVVESDVKEFNGWVDFDDSQDVYFIRDRSGTRLSPSSLAEAWRSEVGTPVYGTYRILDEEEIPDSMIVLDLPVEILEINAWVIISGG